MRRVEKIGPAYEVEMVHDDDTLVQVTITALGGGSLGYDELREATRQMLDRVRPERRMVMPPRSPAVEQLRAVHKDGGGPSSAEYLARLAVAYEEQAQISRDPAARLAFTLGLSTQTVKQHLMRARKDEFLSPTAEGQKGGEATPKARHLLR